MHQLISLAWCCRCSVRDLPDRLVTWEGIRDLAWFICAYKISFLLQERRFLLYFLPVSDKKNQLLFYIVFLKWKELFEIESSFPPVLQLVATHHSVWIFPQYVRTNSFLLVPCICGFVICIQLTVLRKRHLWNGAREKGPCRTQK